MNIQIDMDVKIRQAINNEAIILSDLTWRSKGYWGYDEEFLRDCGELLNIKSSYIENSIVFVLEVDRKICGFYGISFDSSLGDGPIMAYMQVDPNYIGKGYGRMLWDHAISEAKQQGWRSFKIHSDPNAERFFKKMGAIHISERPSRYRENRVIPILEYSLN